MYLPLTENTRKYLIHTIIIIDTVNIDSIYITDSIVLKQRSVSPALPFRILKSNLDSILYNFVQPK